MPKLNLTDSKVVALFASCQSQWEIDGFSGRKIRLPYRDVAEVAKWMGIEMSDFALIKFQVCEDEVLKYEAKKAKIKADSAK